MSAALSAIPEHKRRRLARTLGLFGLLFLAVGGVALTGSGSAGLIVIVVLTLTLGVLLLLLAWGVAVSVRHEQADRSLDAALEAALAANGKSLRDLSCGCGHEHDPDELHVVDAESAADEACAHDGSGVACTHSCETCVLAAQRPAPGRS